MSKRKTKKKTSKKKTKKKRRKRAKSDSRQTSIPGTMGAVRRRKVNGKTYVSEMRRCNKTNCGRCPHGPYWYEVRSDGSRKYVGTEAPTQKKKTKKTKKKAKKKRVAKKKPRG